MTRTWRTWAACAAGACVLLSAAGCAKPKPGTQPPAQATAAQAERDAREAWMRTGAYGPVAPELKQKILAAFDALEALTAYRIGIYSDQPDNLLQFDGETSGGNWHFGLTKRGQTEPWEFFLIGDRYYSQDKTVLLDNGPNSRARGEELYLPLLKHIRVSAKQTLNGEIKDLGPGELEGVAVHKYDLRVLQPDKEAPVVTALLEIDEARGLLLHAVVGLGAGSESGARRYTAAYLELVVSEIGAVGPISLPDVQVISPAAQKDIDDEVPALP